jgi:ATP synthase protein I
VSLRARERHAEPARLRSAAVPTALTGAALTLASALLAGWPGAVGAAAGGALVVAFFGVDLLALRSASARFPDAPVQLALLGYLAKIVVLGVLLLLLRGTAAIDSTAFAATTITCTVVWLGGQIRAVGRLVTLPAPEPATPEPGTGP